MSRLPVLTLCFLLALTSCGETSAPPAADNPAAPPLEAEYRESLPEARAGDSEEVPPESGSARREAFAAVLRRVHEERRLPDGTELYGASMEDIEGNLFALFDVDGDGQEELLLLWQNAFTAGQMEIVYGYDEASGELREELREFPGVIFYDNGTAEAPWSHNQGKAGAFWPYSLYRYQASGGVYQSVGSADAWDKSLVSDGFPEEADADGNGFVYYLLPADWDGQYDAPSDDGAYLEWRNSYTAGADFLELSFVDLTAENIAGVLQVPYAALSDATTPNAVG